MAVMLKPSAEYNRRVAIIEGLRTGHSATENNSVLWIPKINHLNPLDYVWSVVERVTNKSRHPNVTSLRTSIEAAFVGMDSVTLQITAFSIKYSLHTVFFFVQKYPQSSLANNPVIVEIQCGSAYPLLREALPSNGLKRQPKRGLRKERGASNPL
ncbi:hypothetical protein G5I_11885 [Acromyrmex echinatior]|uniref:Uncharacterized protein n=1 Tax=Acromyrmex echinatior TaxID=103372 RepID=F4X0T7_ACREC|nr:hypothetical protein G5I_11885 [Acromyrmex echinatior]